ncbi:hypothetical protein [Duganella violaceipulchra]|uniref:Uncharacterized protein n=1 Tax=Duganella violaceipulchra TaxID=2849652 RepID=A0AA41HCN2_9BURK|nr:hypothetical protein [Duganella violaceicalia]MBV6322457.1 hypothetical protein [Duganella violaceicalia]MCP2010662.1 hypothetical protein [Duganella violaceicalia]
MAEVNKLPIPSYLARQRACLAQFMDEHPNIFAAPEGGGAWARFVLVGAIPEGRDRHVVDKALGMLVGTIRSAQMSLNQRDSLTQVFARTRLSGMADFAPDAAALELASADEDPEDLAAYAQAITIYKRCTEAGIIDGNELPRFVEEAFDAMPGTTALARSLIEAANRMVQIDLEHVLVEERHGE